MACFTACHPSVGCAPFFSTFCENGVVHFCSFRLRLFFARAFFHLKFRSPLRKLAVDRRRTRMHSLWTFRLK